MVLVPSPSSASVQKWPGSSLQNNLVGDQHSPLVISLFCIKSTVLVPSRIKTTVVALLKSFCSAPLTSHQKVHIEGTLVFQKGSSARYGEAKAWAAKEDAKGHTYACGCGGTKRVTARQFKTRVPRYLKKWHVLAVSFQRPQTKRGMLIH